MKISLEKVIIYMCVCVCVRERERERERERDNFFATNLYCLALKKTYIYMCGGSSPSFKHFD